MTPEDFLAEHEGHFTWPAPDGAPAGLGLTPVAAFNGRGNHALEVALATVESASSRRRDAACLGCALWQGA